MAKGTKSKPRKLVRATFKLTPETQRLLRATAEKLDVTLVAIVSMGVRLVAAREGVE